MNILKSPKPWIPFIWIFVIVFAIIVFLGIFLFGIGNNKFDWTGIYTEVIGMLLDIIFLGIFWAILEHLRSEKLEIKKYLDEIDDYRNWESEEAMHKTVGNIRRLSKINFTNVDLTYCYLKNAELWNLKITNDATGANFSNAKLAGAELCNINLSHATFEKSHLYKAKLNGSDLAFTNFKGTNLTDVDFRGCLNIDKAYFHGAMFIWEAKFDESIDIEKLKYQQKTVGLLGQKESFFEKKDFIEKKI